MTENEAIEELQNSIELAKMCTQNYERKREIQGYEIAIKALEEVQQYRAVGTVEECRESAEKQKAKKPDYEGDGYSDGQLVYDADAFIKRFHDGKSDTKAQKLMNSTVRRMIREQPTAYDVDAVVKQLEDLKNQVPVNRILDDIINDKPKELGQLIAYDKAIEAVKGGGRVNG